MISMTTEDNKKTGQQQSGGITKLRRLREELRVSQETLARRTSVSLRAYMRAESGKSQVRYNTAMEILAGINGLRVEQGKAPLTLEDLGVELF